MIRAALLTLALLMTACADDGATKTATDERACTQEGQLIGCYCAGDIAPNSTGIGKCVNGLIVDCRCADTGAGDAARD